MASAPRHQLRKIVPDLFSLRQSRFVLFAKCPLVKRSKNALLPEIPPNTLRFSNDGLMPYLAKLFIGGRHSAKVLFLTWAAVFLALIAAAYKIALWNIAADLQRQNQAALTRLTQTHDFA